MKKKLSHTHNLVRTSEQVKFNQQKAKTGSLNFGLMPEKYFRVKKKLMQEQLAEVRNTVQENKFADPYLLENLSLSIRLTGSATR